MLSIECKDYKCNVVGVSIVICVALMTKLMSLDLYEIMKFFRKDRVKCKINNI